VWGFKENRMTVRFEYEAGQWFRSYGNALWEFDAQGLMAKCHASINDLPTDVTERKLF